MMKVTKTDIENMNNGIGMLMTLLMRTKSMVKDGSSLRKLVKVQKKMLASFNKEAK